MSSGSTDKLGERISEIFKAFEDFERARIECESTVKRFNYLVLRLTPEERSKLSSFIFHMGLSDPRREPLPEIIGGEENPSSTGEDGNNSQSEESVCLVGDTRTEQPV